MIIIEVTGTPKGQPRARAFYKPGLGVRMYDAGTAEGWKGQVAIAARSSLPAVPMAGPLMVEIVFRFPRPKCHYRTGKHAGELRPDAPYWHTVKPDRDNAEKAVLDCLTQIGMWRDDCQVCHGEVSKVWSETGGATIKIVERPEKAIRAQAQKGEQ
jgi:crossover junction endodeoxyribonuclease RusA